MPDQSQCKSFNLLAETRKALTKVLPTSVQANFWMWLDNWAIFLPNRRLLLTT